VALTLAVLVLGALWAASSHVQAGLCEQEGGPIAHEHGECCTGNCPNTTEDMRCFLQGCEKTGKNNNRETLKISSNV